MRITIRPKFDHRNHETLVDEYCSWFRGKNAIAPQSFERLYTDDNEVVMVGEHESPESVLDYLSESSEMQRAAASNAAPRRVEYVVVVPVIISYAGGQAIRMWSDGPSAEPPQRNG